MNVNIETNLFNLGKSFEDFSLNICKSIDHIEDIGSAQDESHKLLQNKGNDGSTVAGCYQYVNKNYIILWKDLGGTNLHFSPGGFLHPVLFMKKLTGIFYEAGVPNDERVSLAV